MAETSLSPQEAAAVTAIRRRAAQQTVYHVLTGAVDMYHVDARHALTFKDEWKAKPWTERETEAYKRKQAKSAAAEPEQAADEAETSDE